VTGGPEDGTGTAFGRMAWEDLSGFALPHAEPDTFEMDTLAGTVACTSNIVLP